MKVTKRQIRRIIKEEKARLLNEQYSSAPTIVELLDDTAEIQNKLDAMFQNPPLTYLSRFNPPLTHL